MYELVTRRAVFCVAGADSDYYPMTKCLDDIERDATLASHNIASSASFPNLNNRHLPPDKFEGKSISFRVRYGYHIMAKCSRSWLKAIKLLDVFQMT